MQNTILVFGGTLVHVIDVIFALLGSIDSQHASREYKTGHDKSVRTD